MSTHGSDRAPGQQTPLKSRATFYTLRTLIHLRRLGFWYCTVLTKASHSRYPPLQSFEHYDHGKDADPSSFQELLAGATVTDLTAALGAEVHGMQVSQLGKEGKDQLARFVAEKKVVGGS